MSQIFKTATVLFRVKKEKKKGKKSFLALFRLGGLKGWGSLVVTNEAQIWNRHVN